MVCGPADIVPNGQKWNVWLFVQSSRTRTVRSHHPLDRPVQPVHTDTIPLLHRSSFTNLNFAFSHRLPMMNNDVCISILAIARRVLRTKFRSRCRANETDGWRKSINELRPHGLCVVIEIYLADCVKLINERYMRLSSHSTKFFFTGWLGQSQCAIKYELIRTMSTNRMKIHKLIFWLVRRLTEWTHSQHTCRRVSLKLCQRQTNIVFVHHQSSFLLCLFLSAFACSLFLREVEMDAIRLP